MNNETTATGALIVRANVDQAAALLRGFALGGTADIAVNIAALSEERRKQLVGLLDLGRTPAELRDPSMRKHPRVSGPAEGDLLAAIDAWQAERDAADGEAREKEATERAGVAAALVAAIEVAKTRDPAEFLIAAEETIYRDAKAESCGYYGGAHTAGAIGKIATVNNPDFTVGSTRSYNYDQEVRKALPDYGYSAPGAGEVHAVIGEYVARIAAVATARRADDLEKARPELAAALAAARAEMEKAAAEKAAALAAKKAARLASGLYIRDIGSYNSRREGQPWIAQVTLDGGKLSYAFGGECTAKWGSAGEISIECAPGDVIAWGQKDLRRPDKSAHTILVMAPDGGMREIDRTEALHHLRARAKA